MSVEYNKDASIPVPRKYLDFEGFWEGADQGKLMVQKCGDCGDFRQFPQPMWHTNIFEGAVVDAPGTRFIQIESPQISV